MLNQPLSDPFVDTPLGIGNQSTLGGGTNDRLVGRPWTWSDRSGVKEISVSAVAQDEPVLGIKQNEPFRDRFDRIHQTALDLFESDLGISLCADIAPGPDHFDRCPSLSRIRCHSSCTQQ
jgi:hypothetical protein